MSDESKWGYTKSKVSDKFKAGIHKIKSVRQSKKVSDKSKKVSENQKKVSDK